MNATDSPAPTAAAEGGAQTYAVLDAHGQRLGVLATAVVQVVPCPDTLARLPRASPTLAGVVPLRGRAVPVVNLALWQGGTPAAGEHAPSHIAVLADGSDWIGLLIDGVRGLARIAPADIQRLHHDDAPDEFFHSVAPAGAEHGLLALLDAAQLMQRARAWSADSGADTRQQMARAEAESAGGGDSAGRFAVIRIGERLYGLPAAALAEVLPQPALQAVLGHDSDLLGMLRWRERDVPLVDPSIALGSPGRLPPAPWVAVVQAGARCLAVPCHGVEQVRAFARADVQPAADAAGLCAAACSGLVPQADGQPLRLVDAHALLSSFGISAVSEQAARAGSAQTTQAHNREALVVFLARSRFAAPIGQLQAIMPLPDGLQPQAAPDGLAGSVSWRGQALPLVDLQRRLWPGQPPVTAARRILVTHLGDQLTALLVGEVEALIPAHAGVQTQVRLPDGQCLNMVTVQQDAHRASYRLIDLQALPPLLA